MADEADTAPDETVSSAAEAFAGLLGSKKPDAKPPARQETQAGPDDAEADEPEAPGPDDTESDDADASGGDNASSIDPPKSMPEELRAEFSKLPPDLQKFLVERERNIERGGAKVAGKAGEERKAMEASRQRYETELQRIAQAATQFRHPDIVTFETKFKDVIEGKTDIQTLKDSDPLGRFMDYTIARDKAAQGWNQQEALKAQFQNQQQETVNRYREAENAKLTDMIPALRDKAKWDAFEKDVSKYVMKHAERYGESKEAAMAMLKQGSAWALEMASKAMKYDSAAQKIREAETKPGQNGKVLKPGTADRRNGQGERFNALVNRVAKTGRVEDAAGAFSAMLSGKRR
jgi:hypothetical protein